MSSPVKDTSQTRTQSFIRGLGYTGEFRDGLESQWLNSQRGIDIYNRWAAAGTRTDDDARTFIRGLGYAGEFRDGLAGQWLEAENGGGIYGRWATQQGLTPPAQPDGFDPAAAQAVQAERQLAARRRGRGAMLLTGTAGLDPDAGGSVARRLLTGVAA